MRESFFALTFRLDFRGLPLIYLFVFSHFLFRQNAKLAHLK